MREGTFDQGIKRLYQVFPGLKPKDEAAISFWESQLDVWEGILSDLSDSQFEQAIASICRRVKDIFPSSNLAALIVEHAPEERRYDQASQEDLDRFLEGAKGRGIRGIVDQVSPGTWDISWVQTAREIYDRMNPPEERCRFCGEYVTYYWVDIEWLYRRWGQNRPFWLRVECPACDEGKAKKRAGQEVMVGVIEDYIEELPEE